MGFSKFFVKIEPDPEVFFPGQVVKGNVYASATSPIRCRVVDIKFKGKAKVLIGHGDDVHRDYEEYFSQVRKLFNGSSDTVEAGDYVWPFQFTLPKNIPSSFEGPFGYVRYCVKVVADIPLGLDDKNKVYFSVSDTADLNSDFKAKAPMTIQKSDVFCCFCCTKGPVQLNFNCPKSGAVVEEGFKIRGEISNEGSKPVESTEIILTQEVTFHVKRRRWNKSYEVSKIERGTIDPGESEHYDDAPLKIKSVPPNLRNCKLIDLEYKITFRANMGKCGSCSDSATLLIGTVPFIPEGLGNDSSNFTRTAPNVAVPDNSELPPGFVAVPGNPVQKENNTLANPYGLKGAPAGEDCYFCLRNRRPRLDKKSPPPKYLSYDRILMD